ncbi:cupredoxin domain-containing protein [Escherichia coli]|uniref:cupredoxin domain-containing protein n=1 Tax=Escherichia coli TaxID=562 RepID=UPI000E1CEB7D|nr:cupredoxin domain-containing protein [Escherichia coli]
MTINFRRNALQLSVAALFSSAFMANAADVPQVKVTVTDKQCEPMTITVNAGKTQFIIQNHSQKALEWEILKGVMVVEERENIAPGFSQKMTANLQPGEYDMTCGLLTNPKGKLIVKGEATADAAQSDALLSLGGAITAYDVPDYASDPEGKGIALDSHIRLANPRTAESESSLMLRRGYSYSLGVTNSGQLDMGLLFVCYQHDLEKGFLTVQKRLNGEALEEYVKPIGGGYFFALPGVKDANDYLGSALLRV